MNEQKEVQRPLQEGGHYEQRREGKSVYSVFRRQTVNSLCTLEEAYKINTQKLLDGTIGAMY